MHNAVRAALSQSECYWEGGPVEVRETHISVVFLTAEYAYKLLKTVRFDFLDFSTREARYAECWNEVRLNRRLAGDVYLDVVPVIRSADGFQLGGAGFPVDWVIKMRRLAEHDTLAARIESATATSDDLPTVLDVLQPFFESANRGPQIDADADVSVIRRNLVENHDVLEAHAGTTGIASGNVAALRSIQLQLLATRRRLFEDRIRGGWIRDGHGDLRAEHVYLTNPPVIVDCIAFNNRFRHVDLLDEICFLATDLQRLGRDDLATAIVDQYRRRLNDPAPDALAHFFASYRFAVRAKVACLKSDSADLLRSDEFRSEESQSEAAQLLQRAVDALRADHAPCLVVFCGVSGSGKSTVARRLAEEIGAVHLASDVIRKELHSVDVDDHPAGRRRE